MAFAFDGRPFALSRIKRGMKQLSNIGTGSVHLLYGYFFLIIILSVLLRLIIN